ncbi:MAG: hypothetical protein DI544_08410 [Sphingomonas taxi]|uniref:Homogentisate 1,2-dioxygenase n=1 Tax=Sphingomonas taxi TaxID=1549858 RepID=A0A2W5QR50_9SPHN|nr:MAG: hypothetical protein DI544_08410 [Sphingomonas taxi]
MSPALLLPLLLAAAPLPPQDAAVAADASCATTRPAWPAGLETWGTREPLAAGASARNAPVIVIGRAAELRLVALDRVTVAAPPARAVEPGTSAGLALFQVTEPGTYRVALGAPAWIDVVRAGRTLPSVAHGHGPMCTGIRKIVDFRLTPGRYVLQLTGAQATALPVMIARSRRAAA